MFAISQVQVSPGARLACSFEGTKLMPDGAAGLGHAPFEQALSLVKACRPKGSCLLVERLQPSWALLR